MQLRTDNWHYLHGKPDISGVIKRHPEDFVVIEELGYEPVGEGEHIYLWVEKVGLNTAFVAEQLAKFTGLPLRAITYAGRKDKHAVTRQWFGVHKPGKTEYDWQNLKLDGLTIIAARRHDKKLRTGVLKGNRFELTLRDLSGSSGLSERLEQIRTSGVPNYYGEQRFGDSRHHPQGGNLALAETMLAGEAIRNRNKRSMAISALRSWLFNEFVSARVESGQFATALRGDAMQLAGSNSFFIADEIDDALTQRMSERDVLITAPLWGKGELHTSHEARTFEQDVANNREAVCQGLESLGLKQERRAISLFPAQLEYTLDGNTLFLSFSLPAGCFATSVIRELIQCLPEENQ